MASVALHNPSSAVQLNVEMYRYLGLIASDEGLMTKAVKYVQKLAEKKSELDETEYILSSPHMVEILHQGDEEIAKGQGQKVAVEDLWK